MGHRLSPCRGRRGPRGDVVPGDGQGLGCSPIRSRGPCSLLGCEFRRRTQGQNIGHRPVNRHNFVHYARLTSDVLGLSTQTIAINNPAHASSAAATEATAFGPFFLEDTPEISFGSATAGTATCQPCGVEIGGSAFGVIDSIIKCSETRPSGAPALTAATSTTKPGPGPASTSSSARGNPKLP